MIAGILCVLAQISDSFFFSPYPFHSHNIFGGVSTRKSSTHAQTFCQGLFAQPRLGPPQPIPTDVIEISAPTLAPINRGLEWDASAELTESHNPHLMGITYHEDHRRSCDARAGYRISKKDKFLGGRKK